MRYALINSVSSGSTGSIMLQIAESLRAKDNECWCFWARGRKGENPYECNFGSPFEIYTDVLLTRCDGRTGFHSKAATRRLLSKLEEIHPDIVHLHNLHGYYLNVELLFDWLLSHEEVQVRWTLHDCWAFTGHCSSIDAGCEQWKTFCARDGQCPQLKSYPKTYANASSALWSYEKKRDLFTSLSPDRMRLIVFSNWLRNLVASSYLNKYSIEVRHNEIDRTIFKPTSSDFRVKYGIGNRFMILGVAYVWSELKRLDVFEGLADRLDEDKYAVVVVGLNKSQIRKFPSSAIALPRTRGPVELAEIYSAADLHIQPSADETFGMTVLEAVSCGTPVFVREGSACVEAAQGGAYELITSDIDDITAKVIEFSRRTYK